MLYKLIALNSTDIESIYIFVFFWGYLAYLFLSIVNVNLLVIWFIIFVFFIFLYFWLCQVYFISRFSLNFLYLPFLAWCKANKTNECPAAAQILFSLTVVIKSVVKALKPLIIHTQKYSWKFRDLINDGILYYAVII